MRCCGIHRVLSLFACSQSESTIVLSYCLLHFPERFGNIVRLGTIIDQAQTIQELLKSLGVAEVRGVVEPYCAYATLNLLSMST